MEIRASVTQQLFLDRLSLSLYPPQHYSCSSQQNEWIDRLIGRLIDFLTDWFTERDRVCAQLNITNRLTYAHTYTHRGANFTQVHQTWNVPMSPLSFTKGVPSLKYPLINFFFQTAHVTGYVVAAVFSEFSIFPLCSVHKSVFPSVSNLQTNWVKNLKLPSQEEKKNLHTTCTKEHQGITIVFGHKSILHPSSNFVIIYQTIHVIQFRFRIMSDILRE